MQKIPALLYALFQLVADVGFAIASLAVVIVASVLTLGFAAEPELIASILVLGFLTALADTKLQAGQMADKDIRARQTFEQPSDPL
ncbi:hypothetical protein ACFFWD_43570 [Bradyrhizobium erythrophlei]|uniref:hypothetical protein n=1 Tax=Bradyrhizobium erythrophlei TaxID=1437360 RepID=UPI0035E72328